MSGAKGRSGGWNKKPPLRPAGPSGRAVVPEVSTPPAWLLAGLGAAGGRLVRGAWAELGEWTTGEQTLLRSAALIADDIEATSDPRSRRSSTRTLATILGQLAAAARMAS